MLYRRPDRFGKSAGPRCQRGSVAVIVGLSVAVLAGFMGIALDVGRLYVNRSELQSAADACALAAAAELTCNPAGGACPASFLLNAQAAGIFAAGRNKRDFQVNAVAIAPADVQFHTALAPNTSYLSIAAGANSNSKYAMCTARAVGIAPWFMSVLGAGAQTVTASAVGTLAPGQSFCNAAPVGLCQKAGGYQVGEWITSAFTGNVNDSDLTGSFRWVDFTPGGGGVSEANEQLVGRESVCNIRLGDDVALPGQKQGIKFAYNTRFGMYPNGANAETPDTAPPDRTGYSYPSKSPGAVIPVPAGNPPIGNAYNNYVSQQNSNTLFTPAEYDKTGAAANMPGNSTTSANLLAKGSDRRLVAAPLINCAAGNVVPIVSMACVLMLNPMSQGATGEIYLEYRGDASLPGSPCRIGGFSGGPNGAGPQVPTLVQ